MRGWDAGTGVHFCRNAMIKQQGLHLQTTLKTLESHLLSVVTNMLKQWLWLWKQLIRIIKKKQKIPHECFAFTLRKKETFFFYFPNSFFLLISQLGLWLKQIWKRRTKPGSIIQRRTSCLPLKAYKNKFGLQTGIQGDFHIALSFQVSLLIFYSSLLFSKFIQDGGCWTTILSLSL